MTVSVHVYYPIPLVNVGIGHICLAVSRYMRNDTLDVSVIAPVVRSDAKEDWVHAAVPPPVGWLPYRVASGVLTRRLAKHYLDTVASADVAYLWSEVPLPLTRALRDRGTFVVREKYNCAKAVSKGILDEAYNRLGWPPEHGITDEAIEKEREEFALANAVCAPSPAVRESLLRDGVPANRIIESSYGWEPARIGPAPVRARRNGPITYLFAGAVCVRKGVPHLLAAWKRAGLENARLVLAGEIEPGVRKRCADLLGQPNVEALGFVRDVASAFREADVFVFPTLEEGDPLVTHEAMAMGLPLVVTKMGAGSSARDQLDGIVVPDHDVEALAAAMQRMARDTEFRIACGRSALARAANFTWEVVAKRRRQSLIDSLTRARSPSAVGTQVEIVRRT